ncbi:methyltransferase type 11 [Pholiota conissans]|uniref:Methyltransferase type 11 n=1 Tax=Pholiota conissans TaxID=109636 RepID=A0A9P5YVI9_9AGAR|nr:methyltransferase type 11 [Pholiota conissans]
MTSVHQIAQKGFGSGTNELYDRIRPTYQPFTLEFIRESITEPGPLNIVEIGSGTGIFTRAILADPQWNARIKALKAVEPSQGMRDTFAEKVKDDRISLSEGFFDATGVEDGWADLVVIAQAYHWCPDYEKASAEFARILKLNGTVALVWNLEDRDGAKWVAQVRDLIEFHEQGTPQFRHNHWRQTFDTPSYQKFFEPHIQKTWSYHIQGTKESVVDRASSKSYIMLVSFYANLPLEVKQVLRASDFNKDPYSGEIDTITGFALIVSVQTCFVWQHAQAIKGIPTCYIFSCPRDIRFRRPPFHSLVPQGPAREPGLILVSSAGQIRFWESIGIGLAGGDNFVASQLEGMEYEEEVTNLIRADAQTYILSTSYGGLYRLVLTSTGGKYHLSVRAFAMPTATHTFSMLTSFFLPSAASTSSFENKDVSKHIHAVAVSSAAVNGDRNVWALANGRIQQWNMKSEGWEEAIMDEDLTELLYDKIDEKINGQGSDSKCKDLELSDLAIFSNNNLAVLVSYVGKEIADGFRRLYALVELDLSGPAFNIKSLRNVPYQTTSKPGPPVHPRIQPIYGGSIISVQFGDVVALVARESEYRDRLELKSLNDRTLGLGVSQDSNFLLILTATSMMKVSLDLEKIDSFMPETGHTNLVKSTMMQAILYGASPLNPLKFSFPPELNEDALMQGAEQLSQAVLKSDPEVVRQSPDMTAQLNGRKERLSWLIGFINENAVLVKMSDQSRQKLATDAEKLYGSHQLWLTYNQFLSSTHSQSVLKDAVAAFLGDNRDGAHEDVMRVFFRSHVEDIGRLLKKVADLVSAAARSPGGNVNALLPEANRVVVTVLRSATQYRAYNLGVYGIKLPMSDSWTSKSSIIDTVLLLFNFTAKAVETSLGYSSHGRDREPTSQLPSLASVLFESVTERIDWLASTKRDNQREFDEFQQRFSVLRPEVLDILRVSGYAEAAYSLAEKYHDFTSLVALCHRDTVYPPENNPHAERIHSYIQIYKEDFTNELFQWYIQHGEVRTMFAREAQLGAYIDAYFRQHPNIAISWIRDLGKSGHGSAASVLLQDAQIATDLEAKHLMLSIGKLSHLVQIHDSNASTDDPILNAFHDGLDFVSVLEGLLEEFRSVLIHTRSRQSLDGQCDTIVKAKGGKFEGKPAFLHMFKDILRQLLQGKALSVEDAVELLTLKDNSQTVEDFATSLHLLTSATNLPEARKVSALRTVWRRVYLHDDWENIQKTDDVSDDELNARYQGTALFATLCSILSRPTDDRPLIVEPTDALMISSKEEIASRWPGMPVEQVEAMTNDYNSEQDILGELVLDDVFARILELAECEVEEEQQYS